MTRSHDALCDVVNTSVSFITCNKLLLIDRLLLHNVVCFIPFFPYLLSSNRLIDGVYGTCINKGIVA